MILTLPRKYLKPSASSLSATMNKSDKRGSQRETCTQPRIAPKVTVIMTYLFSSFLSNPWTIGIGVTVTGGLIVGLILYYIFGIGKDSKPVAENVSHNRSSPFIKAGGSISAGGDIIVGNHEINTSAGRPIPEFHLQLYGSGANLSFEGHIEKKSSITLVVLYIEIDGVKTEVNQPFTKLVHLKDLRFDQSIFKHKKSNISVKVYYKKLTDGLFEYSQTAKQELRADKRFNIALVGAPKIKQISGSSETVKLIRMNSWIAGPTEEEQGSDFRELNLAGNSLDRLIFTVSPTTLFWRAGFKLLDPNSSVIPLRNANSLLFHLGSSDRDNRFGITAYINGNRIGAINKTKEFELGDSIEIGLEVSEKNFIKVYVNNTLEFEPAEQIDPRLLKRACLIAWGDGQNYNVKFDNTKFTMR